MNCGSCGRPSVEGDQFCAHCGAPLAQPAPPAQTMPMPPAGPAYAPATMPPPQKGLPAGLVIALSIVGVLVVAGVGTGGYFALKALSRTETPSKSSSAVTATPSTTAPEDTAEESPAPVGFATVTEAVEDKVPAGWVYEVLSDNGDSMEYVTGPPNSEYSDVLVVEKQPDGSWSVVDTYAFDTGEMDGAGSESAALSPEDDARQIVGEFLYAVKEDRADDAHAFTIPPFSEDPASAQFSNGDLKSIEVLSATLQSDNTTVKVRSRETWTWGTEEWIYVCVPTDAGYRITNLLAP